MTQRIESITVENPPEWLLQAVSAGGLPCKTETDYGDIPKSAPAKPTESKKLPRAVQRAALAYSRSMTDLIREITGAHECCPEDVGNAALNLVRHRDRLLEAARDATRDAVAWPNDDLSRVVRRHISAYEHHSSRSAFPTPMTREEMDVTGSKVIEAILADGYRNPDEESYVPPDDSMPF